KAFWRELRDARSGLRAYFAFSNANRTKGFKASDVHDTRLPGIPAALRIRLGSQQAASLSSEEAHTSKMLKGQPLYTTMMLEYIKTNHRRCFNYYVTGKKTIVSADNAMMRLLQRFSK
ncbi:hypothetical protein GN958_ATG04526, partial [Phytophthora infestans]